MATSSDNQAALERNELFLRLYSHHQRQIHAYLGTFLRNPADVDEVLQETSIVLWRKFDQFDTERSFLAWACGIARLEMLKFSRQNQHAMLPLSEEQLVALSDHWLSMDKSLDSRREALAGCMEKLRPRDRDLVSRCYASGATSNKVAEELGRPVNAVYKSLGRIRRTLMSCIQRQMAREVLS